MTFFAIFVEKKWKTFSFWRRANIDCSPRHRVCMHIKKSYESILRIWPLWFAKTSWYKLRKIVNVYILSRFGRFRSRLINSYTTYSWHSSVSDCDGVHHQWRIGVERDQTWRNVDHLIFLTSVQMNCMTCWHFSAIVSCNSKTLNENDRIEFEFESKS